MSTRMLPISLHVPTHIHICMHVAELTRLGLKTFFNTLTMTLSYPFDTSINHPHMSNFQHRIRSAPSPLLSPSSSSSCSSPDRQAKLTLPCERWELEALYISPEHQRKGYGTEALTWGLNMAREEKVQIWVWSSDAGKPAYQKVGFEVLGRIEFGDLLVDTIDTTDAASDGSKEVAVWVMRWMEKD